MHSLPSVHCPHHGPEPEGGQRERLCLLLPSCQPYDHGFVTAVIALGERVSSEAGVSWVWATVVCYTLPEGTRSAFRGRIKKITMAIWPAGPLVTVTIGAWQGLGVRGSGACTHSVVAVVWACSTEGGGRVAGAVVEKARPFNPHTNTQSPPQQNKSPHGTHAHDSASTTRGTAFCAPNS